MRPTLTPPLPGTLVDPLYPDSDGRPMGDTDYHSLALIHILEALRLFFARQADVYIGMNLLYYFQQGNPRGRHNPDILVAKGVGNHLRRSFRVWEERNRPCTFIEVVSKSTLANDLGEKPLLYARLRIPEYFLFDPEGGEFMDPPLRGYRLSRGKYVEMTPAADGSLSSKELGLRLTVEGDKLRFFDLKTGKPLLTGIEQVEHAKYRIRKGRRQVLLESERAEAEHPKRKKNIAGLSSKARERKRNDEGLSSKAKERRKNAAGLTNSLRK